MNDFGAFSVLSQKCQRCPKVSTCDHKRMEHLRYIIPPIDTRGNGKLDFQRQLYDAMKRRIKNDY